MKSLRCSVDKHERNKYGVSYVITISHIADQFCQWSILLQGESWRFSKKRGTSSSEYPNLGNQGWKWTSVWTDHHSKGLQNWSQLVNPIPKADPRGSAFLWIFLIVPISQNLDESGEYLIGHTRNWARFPSPWVARESLSRSPHGARMLLWGHGSGTGHRTPPLAIRSSDWRIWSSHASPSRTARAPDTQSSPAGLRFLWVARVSSLWVPQYLRVSAQNAHSRTWYVLRVRRRLGRRGW